METTGKINKVGIIFHRYGPYHICRIDALNKSINTIGIELSGVTKEYKWDKITDEQDFERITLFTDKDSRDVSIAELKTKIYKILDETKPNLMLINGWGDKGGLLALKWCIKNKVSTILMTDETETTHNRKYIKELLKRKIVQLFDAALVAGKPQIKYVKKLGIRPDLIETCYDVVDNQYFIGIKVLVNKNPELYQKKYDLPDQYFVTSNRFIEKKNLIRLLEAYKKYFEYTGPNSWKLVMIGDGKLKESIIRKINELGLSNQVIMTGFLQYDEFPYYFSLAKAFIQASTSEQWGLVVNEAMASGLPVLVSNQCGCVEDLVIDGRNGYSFDPYNIDELAEKMILISSNEIMLTKMGGQSQEIIYKFSPDKFVSSIRKLINKLQVERRSFKTIFGRLFLSAVIYSSSIS